MNALYWLLPVMTALLVSSVRAEVPYDFCADDDKLELCPTLPQDLSADEAVSTYSFMDAARQMPFDRFAWRTLVALNWPVSGGNLEQKPWEKFVNTDRLFPSDRELKCVPEPDQLHVWRYMQSSGQPLIDSEGNYVVYAVHVNGVMADQIRAQNLHSKAGQAEQSEISFQSGRHDGRKSIEAALMLKTAWRLLPEDSSDNTRFFVRKGLVEIPPSDSFNKERLCLNVTLGLVGKHAVHKTTSGFGDHWIWSTYEHIDNVPMAANARRIQSTDTLKLFEGGCRAPEEVKGQYNFFPRNRELARPQNVAWKWNDKPPFAVSDAGESWPPDQVVRCWKIFEGTQKTNQIWRDKLAGTVWENYMLISAQWRGDIHDDPIFGVGELPRYLANTAIESFIQEDTSCMSCHKGARDALGRFSDFTFLLRKAK